MILGELKNVELLSLYKNAIGDLAGGGAKARAWLAEVEKEVLYRMDAICFIPMKKGDLL